MISVLVTRRVIEPGQNLTFKANQLTLASSFNCWPSPSIFMCEEFDWEIELNERRFELDICIYWDKEQKLVMHAF